MKNQKAIAFLNAFGTAVYVAFVAFIMQNGEAVFGKMNNLLGPVAFLLLFVLSAAVVGALILGRPIVMYLDGQKKDAIKMFIQTALWLAIITLAVLLSQIII